MPAKWTICPILRAGEIGAQHPHWKGRPQSKLGTQPAIHPTQLYLLSKIHCISNRKISVPYERRRSGEKRTVAPSGMLYS